MRLLLLLLFTVSASAFTQAAPDIDEARAQSNYMLNCQGCHLADGTGLPGLARRPCGR